MCVCTCLTCPECVWVLSVYVVHLCTAAPCRLPVVSNETPMLTFPQRVVVLSALPSDTHVQRWKYHLQCIKSSSFEGLTCNSSCILCKALSERDRTESITDRSRLKRPSTKQTFLDLPLLLSILDCQNQNSAYCRATLTFNMSINGYSDTEVKVKHAENQMQSHNQNKIASII